MLVVVAGFSRRIVFVRGLAEEGGDLHVQLG